MKVLIFTAPWCVPCRQLKKDVDRIHAEILDFLVEYIDVSKDRKTAQRFKIKSVPTILIIGDGRILKMIVGAPKYSKLKQEIIKYYNIINGGKR